MRHSPVFSRPRLQVQDIQKMVYVTWLRWCNNEVNTAYFILLLVPAILLWFKDPLRAYHRFLILDLTMRTIYNPTILARLNKNLNQGIQHA